MTNESKDTGGPAFPGKQKALVIQAEHREIASQYEIEHNGMTLRDYFAAKAMSIVMPPVLEEIRKRNISEADVAKLKQVSADACYGMADAMLKAREQ